MSAYKAALEYLDKYDEDYDDNSAERTIGELRELTAEITRLRAALEIIADDRLPGGRGPAEFARRALDGMP